MTHDPKDLVGELRALLDKATPGPWEDDGYGIGHSPGKDPWHVIVVGKETKGAPYMEYEELVLRPEDAALIIALRNAAPGLLDERDRLRKALSGAVLGLKMVLTKPTEAQAKMLAAFDDVLRGDGTIFDVWAKDETP